MNGSQNHQFVTVDTDVGANPDSTSTLGKLFGRFSNAFSLWGPYKVPTVPLLGGGNSVQRQLNPLAPQIVAPQLATLVGITGDGSNLQGQFAGLPLVDRHNAAPGN